jgi:hypothetical protein
MSKENYQKLMQKQRKQITVQHPTAPKLCCTSSDHINKEQNE